MFENLVNPNPRLITILLERGNRKIRPVQGTPDKTIFPKTSTRHNVAWHGIFLYCFPLLMQVLDSKQSF